MKMEMKGIFSIRELEIKEISKVRSLWQKTSIKPTYSDKKEEIVKMINHNPGLCLVLENSSLKGEIFGVVLGGFDGRRGWIHHLAIDPSIQGKKYGTLMMSELIKRFKEKGVVKLKLEILESNKAVIEFYKKNGWNNRPELTTMSLTLKE